MTKTNKYGLWFGRIITSPLALLMYIMATVHMGIQWWECKFFEQHAKWPVDRKKFQCPACGCKGIVHFRVEDNYE